MGATWISWRTTTTVIITILQIQARISVKTTAVNGVEGQRFDFRCKYEDGQQNNAKYFCYENDDNDDKMSSTLIRTQKHDQWDKGGRFSLYDNTTGAFFIVRVDSLTSEDSGTYRCGVNAIPDHISFIHLNVSREIHLSLFVTAAMCIAAMLFICLFTLCLLLAIRHQRPGARQNRETSSDYETMMPGVRTEPELSCSSPTPDCADPSALPSPPPDLCSHFTSKHRESTVTLDEYVDVDVPKQYQHLDLSRLEEHVYHSLNGLSDPKDGPLGVKKQINC
ncbi:uncharacterized protein LOC116393002 isoform X2 [Anarrhichthys ocellatus]|uniref:uncharacterized protein LOC116393002 isoform X2 n=1 Tax=Anarrhichthys ocellatus TaxID=433405 RepID=UPI0012ECF50A|nr:uncharacterized protein LOC116393002 isoform X2 [Anarrhichthys ocellatus]